MKSSKIIPYTNSTLGEFRLNIGFAIVGQSWLIEHFYFYLALCKGLTFRFQIPNHRKAVNRYAAA
jgi:hypothetical protein